MYNNCYGGFGFSKQFTEELSRLLGEEIHRYHPRYRTNQVACKLLLEKGCKWSCKDYSKLQMVSVPAVVEDYVSEHEYDGKESIYIDINTAIVSKTRKYIKNPSEQALTELKEFISIVDKCEITDVKVPE